MEAQRNRSRPVTACVPHRVGKTLPTIAGPAHRHRGSQDGAPRVHAPAPPAVRRPDPAHVPLPGTEGEELRSPGRATGRSTSMRRAVLDDGRAHTSPATYGCRPSPAGAPASSRWAVHRPPTGTF